MLSPDFWWALYIPIHHVELTELIEGLVLNFCELLYEKNVVTKVFHQAVIIKHCC